METKLIFACGLGRETGMLFMHCLLTVYQLLDGNILLFL